MPTTLHHLVFWSEVQAEPTDTELLTLLHRSQAYNQRHGITGVLLYQAGQLMTVLEGPRDAVRTLFERIQLDARHRNVLLLSDGPAVQPTFPDWTVGFAPASPEEFCPPATGYFDPQRQPLLQHHAPAASPYLLNMLEEFVAARPEALR